MRTAFLVGLCLLAAAARADFQCPGRTYAGGSTITHEYLVRVQQPHGRILFAWCADGSVYWRHGPVQGPEKLRRVALRRMATPAGARAGLRPVTVTNRIGVDA
jgi:hypothetical protein